LGRNRINLGSDKQSQAVFADNCTVLTFMLDGLLTGFPAAPPFTTSEFSINCPIVQRLEQFFTTLQLNS